jgi:hypothetical protein
MNRMTDGWRVALAELAAVRTAQARTLERLEALGADVSPLREAVEAIDRKVAALEALAAAAVAKAPHRRPRLTVVAGGRLDDPDRA